MINDLGKKIFENAKQKGFYDEMQLVFGNEGYSNPIWLSNRLMLITSELSEGLEGVRDGNLSSEPKSGGLGEELADACIRIFDLAYSLNIDLEQAIIQKHNYNTLRPRKHGRKAL